jgi:14-3-3 protein epsilon
LIKDYRKKIEKELVDICQDILSLLNDSLIPACQNADAKVFFLKMKGDYFRYLGEFQTGDDRKSVID